MTPVPLAVVSDWTSTALVELAGFSAVALVVGIVLAGVYRWFSRQRITTGATVVVALTVATVPLYIQVIRGESFVGSTSLFHYASAGYVIGVFAGGAVLAELGRRIGDYIVCDLYGIVPIEADGAGADLLRSARLAVAVRIPETVDSIKGYEPIGGETERALAGQRLLFPRRLSTDELERRIETRVEQDFDVDHVHVSLQRDGTVEEFAAGRRPDGLSERLPPGIAAVAIEADPAADASAGDPVELWETGDDRHELAASGVLRGTDGDVVTIALDAEDATAVDPNRRYRLLTRPNADNDARELALLLWNTDTAVTELSVRSGGRFEGEFVSWLPATVLVIDRDDGPVAFPPENETLQAGDTVYLLGTPAELHEVAEYDQEVERPRPSDTGGIQIAE